MRSYVERSWEGSLGIMEFNTRGVSFAPFTGLHMGIYLRSSVIFEATRPNDLCLSLHGEEVWGFCIYMANITYHLIHIM
jgi:hypothetical protein